MKMLELLSTPLNVFLHGRNTLSVFRHTATQLCPLDSDPLGVLVGFLRLLLAWGVFDKEKW